VTIGGNGVSWRSVEKLLAYGAGIVAATNGFAQVALPTSLRDWLLGASAVIVAALPLLPILLPALQRWWLCQRRKLSGVTNTCDRCRHCNACAAPGSSN
jgi:hypothetical protein